MTTGQRSLRSVLIHVAVFCATVFLFFGAAQFAHAQVDVSSGDEVAQAAGFADASLTDIIGGILNAIMGFLGIITLIIIIYAGFLWMTAGGNADQIDKAKKWLINGVIGLVIVLSAWAITSFIFNLLEQAGLAGGGSDTTNGEISTEPLSGSLGSGNLESHYPARNATDVSRNTMISVTFKAAMDIDSFISGYNDGGTPGDTTDDDDSGVTGLNTDNVLIYATADGESAALAGEEVDVAFTDDLKTFVFYPPILGSSTEDTNYTVFLSDDIQDTEGDAVLNFNGYQWSFEVGTEIDLDPPTVESVSPKASDAHDRNIVVQMTFSEAVDPTSATGNTESGFTNIRVQGVSGGFVEGAYTISNQYRTVTFTPSEACGTNSCGDTIYCLPGTDAITVTVAAATVGETPSQASGFPYDGVVDTSANSLDGNEDGTAGDDYAWSFSTTGDINLEGPNISSITPDIQASDVDLDQPILVTFDGVMMSSTITTDTIALDSRIFETGETPAHELWYTPSSQTLTNEGTGEDYTQTELSHGVLLESTDGVTYQYRIGIGEGLKNEYQNCFDPAQGPGSDAGGTCGTSESEPWCCNGVASASACPTF